MLFLFVLISSMNVFSNLRYKIIEKSNKLNLLKNAMSQKYVTAGKVCSKKADLKISWNLRESTCDEVVILDRL